MSDPWCRLLTQNQLNPTMSVYTTNFLVGTSNNSNLLLNDHTISGILCAIKLTHRGSTVVAVLESKNGKGFVQINGKTVRKNATCDLNSGDELVFGLLGAHAYVSLLVHCFFAYVNCNCNFHPVCLRHDIRSCDFLVVPIKLSL
ncbi:hypothetical protein POM88_020843 [Heracleum sosnowskyi]|uniref:FHA domain-containing protein n=1 Tax=Heracleum sosnowskyi TaxID=360622 RepID=A0AAD8IDE0_9APIA|nr:hypothetical protein POM88_020843 [Heracleum sosnowskyi]